MFSAAAIVSQNAGFILYVPCYVLNKACPSASVLITKEDILILHRRTAIVYRMIYNSWTFEGR